MTHERLLEIREIVTDSRNLGNALESFHCEIQELLAAADCLATIKQHSTIQMKFNKTATLTNLGEGLSGVWNVVGAPEHRYFESGCDGWFERIEVRLERPCNSPERFEAIRKIRKASREQ